MDNRPIGVFDSGVGGLTSVRELHKILPGEDIVYFGDTGRVPYGSRSKQTIRKYAAQDVKYLMTYDVKVVLAACNSVSANLPEQKFRELGLDVPFYETVMPAAREASAVSAEGRIGVIATTATIRSGAFGRALGSIRPTAKLFGNAAPLLVPLVENGMTAPDNQITRLALQQYLEPLIREEIDTLILGCTHYPMLTAIIDDILHSKVQLVDSGAAAARELRVMLCEEGMQADRETGDTVYRVTDTVENFTAVAKNFLFENIADKVEYVDIDVVAEL
jgi:glutamate racemase